MTKKTLWYVCLGLLCFGIVAIAVNAAVTSKTALKPYNPLATNLGAAGTAPAKTVALGEKTGLDVAKKGSAVTGTQEIRQLPVVEEGSLPTARNMHGRGNISNTPSARVFIPETSDALAGNLSSMGEEPATTDGRRPLDDTYCNLAYGSGSGYGVYSNGVLAFKRWINYKRCTGAETNFRIDTIQVSISLATTLTARDTFYFTLDIECPNVAGDSCSGPGTEIWYYSTGVILNSGTAAGRYNVNVAIPTANKPVINKSVFVGEYADFWTGHGSATYPQWSIISTVTQPSCESWIVDPPACQGNIWLGLATAGWCRIGVMGTRINTGTPLACVSHACPNITCVAGDQIEATEFTGSPDSTQMDNDPDGGCNVTPNHWGSIPLNTWKCGKFFTYIGHGLAHTRDTDWYQFTIPSGPSDTMHITMYTEYPAAIFITDLACPNPTTFDSWLTPDGQCTTMVTSSCLTPGTYALMVTSGSFDCPLWPTYADYRIKIASAGTCAPAPTGRCCYNDGRPCVVNTEAQCTSLSGNWTNGLDCSTPCEPWSCRPDFTLNSGSRPTIIRSTTVGAGANCNISSLVSEMGGYDLMGEVTIVTGGYYQFSMCDTTPVWDSKIALTTACCGGTVVYVSDDDCGAGGFSKICGYLDPGTYYLDIAAWDRYSTANYPASGPVRLKFDTCVVCTPAPVNDNCHNALPITVNAATPTCEDITCATVDQPCKSFPVRSTYYYFVLPPNPPDNCYNVKVEMCGSATDSAIYFGVLVKDSCCGTAIDRTTYLPGSCPDGWFTVVFDSVAPGTYYLPVANAGAVGTQCRRVTARSCAPCAICPPSGVPEGEPDCYNGYVDTYDGGCNSNPVSYKDIQCGQTICGKAGTFNGDSTRDLDWYRFTLAQRSYVTWSAVANFDPQIFVIDIANCASPVILASDTGISCDTLSVTTALLNAGTYAAVVAPKFNQGNVPCGTTYNAWLGCTPCSGVDTVDFNVKECMETPDSTNGDYDCTGGCNNDPFPHLYGTIACGQTAVGRSFTYSSSASTGRDTDWWHLSLAAATTVRFTIEADFPARILIISPYEDCVNSPIIGSLDAKQPCTPHTLTMNLPAGDHTVWVAPRSLGNLQVPWPRYYRLTLGCPCVEAKDVTAYLNATLDAVVIHWYAAVSEPYQIWRTTDYNAVYPTSFTQVATVSASAGLNAWSDPDEPATDGYARYVVVHECP